MTRPEEREPVDGCEIHFAPPKNAWNADSPVSTKKRWFQPCFQSAAEWISSIHSIQSHLDVFQEIPLTNKGKTRYLQVCSRKLRSVLPLRVFIVLFPSEQLPTLASTDKSKRLPNPPSQNKKNKEQRTHFFSQKQALPRPPHKRKNQANKTAPPWFFVAKSKPRGEQGVLRMRALAGALDHLRCELPGALAPLSFDGTRRFLGCC